jgi:hypothetical protein
LVFLAKYHYNTLGASITIKKSPKTPSINDPQN